MFEGFTDFVVEGPVEIRGKVGGSGDTALLLLHGYPQNHHEWAVVAPLLSKKFTVVCPDLRGYGQSGKPPDSGDAYSFRQMANDQVGVMRKLGFERFHVVGHGRGARTAHRLALDHPDSVLSASFLDIVPTLDMFARVDAQFARTYWHWFFLQLPSPFPERLIEGDPDHFYQASLFALGKMGPEDFDATQLEAYRRDWRSPDFIRGSCADYRAAAAVDLQLDRQDAGAMIEVPCLVLWGEQSTLAEAFDIPTVWKGRLARPSFASVPAGHFFVDQRPVEVADLLDGFLGKVVAQTSSS